MKHTLTLNTAELAYIKTTLKIEKKKTIEYIANNKTYMKREIEEGNMKFWVEIIEDLELELSTINGLLNKIGEYN